MGRTRGDARGARPLPARLAFAVTSLVAAALIGGCGYTVERTSSAIAADAPRMAIRTLSNDSAEPGLDRMVTEALRREWMRRGQVRLVEDPGGADLVLSGRVLPLQIQTRTLSSVVLALEQTVWLRVELELQSHAGDGTTRARTLPGSLLRESEIFFASADLEASRKNRVEALRRVAGLVAERAADLVATEAVP